MQSQYNVSECNSFKIIGNWHILGQTGKFSTSTNKYIETFVYYL